MMVRSSGTKERRKRRAVYRDNHKTQQTSSLVTRSNERVTTYSRAITDWSKSDEALQIAKNMTNKKLTNFMLAVDKEMKYIIAQSWIDNANLGLSWIENTNSINSQLFLNEAVATTLKRSQD